MPDVKPPHAEVLGESLAVLALSVGSTEAVVDGAETTGIAEKEAPVMRQVGYLRALQQVQGGQRGAIAARTWQPSMVA